MARDGMLVVAFLTKDREDLAKSIEMQMLGFAPLLCFNQGDYMHEHERYFREIHTGKNRFFSGGVNWAMAYIRDDFPDADAVWMLNDDVYGISEKMAVFLYGALMEDQRLAMLTPAYNSSHPPTRPHSSGGIRFVNHIDGAAHMISMRAWNVIGGYDETFPGWGCDLDWCLRARRLGYKLGVDDRQAISHDWRNGCVNKDETIRERYQSGGWVQRLVEKHKTDRIPGLNGYYG